MGTGTTEPLKAPFPAIGGKSRVADLVWDRLGNVDNFVEPFCRSMAVLLRRPAEHFANGYRVETANDIDHFIVNFWRAVQADPEGVARWADWPVTEADLHARHKWLMRSQAAADWRRWMAEDPHHYDAKVAGWWAWGACAWIGGAWCDGVRTEYEQIPAGNQDGGGYGLNRVGSTQVPDMTSGGVGGHRPRPKEGGSTDWVQLPDMDGGRGVPARPARGGEHKVKMPNLGQECATGGVGIHGVGGGRPQLTDAYDIGRGVNGGAAVTEKRRPVLGGATPESPSACGVLKNMAAGTCAARRAWLADWMARLSDRLRLVRTCYGHWARVCDSNSTLTRLGLTGVFLDPPYALNIERMHAWVLFLLGRGEEPPARTGKASRDPNLYASDKGADVDRLVAEVHVWCLKWGGNPEIRIALAGYEGEHNALTELGWTAVEWAASGGYGNQGKSGKKSANAGRERLWFSPACLTDEVAPSLFDILTPDDLPA